MICLGVVIAKSLRLGTTLGVSAKISLDRSGCKFNPIMGHCEILHSLLVHWFVHLLDRLFPRNVAPA